VWFINIQDWLDDTNTGPVVPRLKRKVNKIIEMITYATSQISQFPIDSSPKCWRRPQRKPWKGTLDVFLDPLTDKILWYCPICQDEGMISGWEGLIWDMRDLDGQEKTH
jgi:hypothetical protein